MPEPNSREQTRIKGIHPHAIIANTCRPVDLFMARLAREMRLHEYMIERRKRIRNGQDVIKIDSELRKKFGYLGQLGEREAYMEELNGHTATVKASKREQSARMREKMRNLPFEKAFAKLPDKAPVEVEVDWVRNHPAMARKSRISQQANATSSTILVDEADLLSAPHGPCPSKGAANMLQNWVNQPDKFFITILAEQKKGLAGDKNANKTIVEEEDDSHVASIDDILSAMQAGE